MSRPSLIAGLILALALLPAPARAQGVELGVLPILSGEVEDRIRLRQILGREGTAGFLLRTPSSLAMRASPDSASAARVVRWRLLAPVLSTSWNSDLPSSFNDGALWAGRGLNVRALAGVRIEAGRISLVLAPELLYAANRDLQTIPYPPRARPARNAWATPFHPLPESLDLPQRFGDEPLGSVVTGQSSLTVSAGAVAFGVATENAWWGPAIRNGLLLSSHAAGVPHLFVKTGRPLRTKAGSFEGRWMLGHLEESDYFDGDPANDRRTLSGLGVTFQPAFADGLTLGVARMVYAPLDDGATGLGAAFDFARSVGRPNQEPWPDTPDAWGVEEPLPEPDPGPDQVTSLFARWVLPDAGLEVYGEWARFEQPASFQDLLEFPQHARGHTLGLQWVDARGGGAHLRIQAELTNLEPDGSWRQRGATSTYTSRVVPQGYTHLGQVLGAAIGPGASSQWLAADRLGGGWRAGAFAARVRWDAAAHFTKAVVFPRREDISVFWGLRGGVDLWGWALAAEVATGVRLNYLFQTFQPDPRTGQAEGVDVANTTLAFTLSRSIAR